MSDRPDVETRIVRIENQLEDFTSLKRDVGNMLYWWKGNGTPGARELMTRFVTEDHVERIIDMTVQRMLEQESEKKKNEEEQKKDYRFRKMDLIIGLGVLFIMALEFLNYLRG